MNRAERRRAAAERRRAGRRPGYVHRLTAAATEIAAAGRGKVVQLLCHHDPQCSIYRGGACCCVPTMSAHVDDGTGTVLEIDEDGRVSKRQAS